MSRAPSISSTKRVAYRLNPMGTVLEGRGDEVMAVVKKCYCACARIVIACPAASRSTIARGRGRLDGNRYRVCKRS